jgi:dihydrofolate reductase
MSLAVDSSLYPRPINALKESLMTATYTFDVFSSLDGFGSASGGDWGGYWGKQGPELLDHRLALYSEEQRMVFGANTYRLFAHFLASEPEDSEVRDPWVTRMVNLPATIVSTTLEEPLDWADGTVVSGDAVDIVARLKEESEMPLRSHGSLSMNRALMAAGLVDHVQVTIFPVITGQNARRQHPRAHLPAHPACLSPSTRRDFREDAADLHSTWGRIQAGTARGASGRWALGDTRRLARRLVGRSRGRAGPPR